MSKPIRSVAAVIAALVALVWLPLLAGAALAADVELEPDTTINGCNGVLPTPGSENTTKRLDPTFASDFNPGGIVGYVIDYPVDPTDVGETFEITDCVYVDPPGTGDDAPIAKYFVHFVPNNEAFQLRFSVDIPADTPLGSQFCNYAKTTATPSASQASNRKAGPACFTVGGGLRIEKRSGTQTGPLLPGASFSVVCTPTTASPPTIITGLSNQSVINGNGTVTASGVADDGTIAINGPSGTPCVVTETAAPTGYVVDATPRNLVIPVGTSQTINVFVNQQLGSLSVQKTATGGGGTFSFDVTCDDGETYPSFQMTVAAGDTDTHLVSDAILVGTECTVSETANALFSTVRTPADGTVTIDLDGETVAFTNTRLRGDLVVTKSADVDGTFTFDVDCDGTAYDTTLQISTSGGSGSASVDDIPTGVSCTVTEQSNPSYTSTVIPADGTVTIAVGDNTVAFSNVRNRGRLVIEKASDVDGTFTFDVDCTDNAYDQSNVSITTVNGTGSASVSNIPTGVSCTVTEDSDDHWTHTVVPGDGTVTIAVGDNTVSFANTRVRGDLVIAKTSDEDGTFTFDLDCTDDAYDISGIEITTTNGNGSATVPDVPTGTECTVTERSNPLFTHTVVPSDGTVTIDDDGETVAFANLRNRGSLIVTKSVVDATSSGPYDFAYHVVCGQATYDFHLGTAGELDLTHTITGIPTETQCTVTEDHDSTWAMQVTPDNGTVTISSSPATVAFTNTKLYTDVSITKSSDPVSGSAVTDGDTITYTLSYANAGNIGAEFSITDEIPDGTTYVEGSAGTATLSNGELTWNLSAASGGSGSVSFQVTVDAGLEDPFTVRNVAVLHEGDDDTPSNETEHPVAHVDISKAVDQEEADYGDDLTYTLTVTNPGAAALTGVVVTDELPEGTTFVSASDGGTCDDPCTVVTWPGVDMAPGATLTRTFVVNITTPAAAGDGAITAGVILNTGAVDSAETPGEPSNEVKTIVTAVQGRKLVRTGLPNVPDTVALAIGLLIAGAGLTFAPSWRTVLARARRTDES